VVKSLKNWARAPARMAEKRGRFQGSKKVGVVDKDDVVLLTEVKSATVITSICQYLSEMRR
jgi:hypothetical protein